MICTPYQVQLRYQIINVTCVCEKRNAYDRRLLGRSRRRRVDSTHIKMDPTEMGWNSYG